MTKKTIYIATGAAVFLTAGSLLAYEGYKFYKPTDENTTIEQTKEAVVTKTPVISQNTTEFSLENVNKKSGDIFSVPDTISYSIAPKATKSKVSLTSAGATLFEGESELESPSFEVYPAGRFQDGAEGEIKIELLNNGKVVLTKIVKVKF